MPQPPSESATPRAPRSEIEVFRSHLGKPEYWHVLINPIPILGTGLGAFLLGLALWRRDERLEAAALCLIVLTAIITFPTIKLGQRAYDRMFDTLPLEGQEWLDVHMSRAERAQFVFYLAGALAAASLFGRRRGAFWAPRASQGALAATALAAALAGWIAHAGGQVRHQEFRLGPPPPGALKRSPAQPAPERKEGS